MIQLLRIIPMPVPVHHYYSHEPIGGKIILAIWIVCNLVVLVLLAIDAIRYYLDKSKYKDAFFDINRSELIEVYSVLFFIINGIALFFWLVLKVKDLL